MFPSKISLTINIRLIAITVFAGTVALLFISWAKLADKNSQRFKAGEAAFDLSVTNHLIRLNNVNIAYKACAGYLPLKNVDGSPSANIFYTAYTKTAGGSKRPVTFLFNGGPGSASIWLHMGAIGPVRVQEDGATATNAASWLSFSDLVFIDPVGTGYSRAADGVDERNFYSYQQDINSIALFIKAYISSHKLVGNPKFLVGESYGGLRAIGLAQELQQKYSIKFAGITLVSPALNYQVITFKPGNESAYSYYLPTYSAVAQFHNKLTPDLQALTPEKLMARSAAFARGRYQLFLNMGDSAPEALRNNVLDSLSYFTGLSKTYLKSINGRLSDSRFTQALLKDSAAVIGTFDGRVAGATLNDDPSIAQPKHAYTAAFNEYIIRKLKYKNKLPYLATVASNRWNYGQNANNQYIDASATLKNVMTLNPDLKVNIVGGYYDLATPVGSINYVVDHLQLDSALRKNITVKYYRAGHMIYTNNTINRSFKELSNAFYYNALASNTM